eukprot:2337715-Prymnesium_polylepis.1
MAVACCLRRTDDGYVPLRAPPPLLPAGTAGAALASFVLLPLEQGPGRYQSTPLTAHPTWSSPTPRWPGLLQFRVFDHART